MNVELEENFSEKIEKYIIKSNFDKAISYLKNNSPESFRNELVIQKMKLDKIEKENRLGIIEDSKYQIHWNKLGVNILVLADKIEDYYNDHRIFSKRNTEDKNTYSTEINNKVGHSSGMNLMKIATWVSIGALLLNIFYNANIKAINLLLLIPLAIPTLYAFSSRPKMLKKRKKFSLEPSFESGLYGGAIGGALAGLILAIPYFLNFYPKAEAMSFAQIDLIRASILVIPFCTVVGIIIGATTQLGMNIFRDYTNLSKNWALIIGGILGCIIGAIATGSLGAAFFAVDNLPTPGIYLVIFATMIGVITILLGILFYSYEGKKSYVLRALFIAASLATIFAIIANTLISTTELKTHFRFENVTLTDTIVTGAIYGGILGTIGGLVISLTIVIYNYWNFSQKQRLNELLIKV